MAESCEWSDTILIAGLVILLAFSLSFSHAQLRVGFYSQTCPNAESIVLSAVQQAATTDSTILAAMLRLHFHDCFVEGCDGSILIDNGSESERLAFGHQGVRGFEVVEISKESIEKACGGVVSCADIVALAARDAVFLSGGPRYQVPTGRRDGKVSDISHAVNMPDVSDSIGLLRSKFRAKGLSDADLVLLSGAHTIGTTACFFMSHRLYNFTGGGDSDPAITPDFLPFLTARCPDGGDVNVRLPLDVVSGDVFDVQILRNIQNGTAVIESDARLMDDQSTRRVIESYLAFSGQVFLSDFVRAIIKMGRIGVKTGSSGEIRRFCGSFN